ncbi:serine/threonine-protein kinase [Micromonospora chersina]|uniref:serine/threonine-protein kinase n=1 Tax=Micromonospora chersina TaxID=47854 RepID=UPI0036B9E7A6
MSLKDRYKVDRCPMAHKGMGEVWPAHDTLLDRPVIVKILATMDADLLRRFRREARLTARLDHPGVPAVYDLGAHEGLPFVVLQKIDGITLTDLVAEQGPLPIPWVAAIGAQISSVLLAAQQIGLVHRDIKPSNVMLDRSGAVKVLDFGLAVVRGDERYSRITQTGQSLGTVGYMAPEQILGRSVDHRTDLYGLGATLFDLLTGRAPFDDATTMTTVRRQLADPPPRPAELRADIPPELDDLIQSLLATDPEDRPASAAEAYRLLAPLAQDRPPIPGVLADDAGPTQAYTAVLGQPSAPASSAMMSPAASVSLGIEQGEKQAEQLEAAGEYRAAAREWRRLAHHIAQQRGDDHPMVFTFLERAARAHIPLGEHDRAMRQLSKLLEDRLRVNGSDHVAVMELRRQIAQLSVTQPIPPPPRRPPGSGR